MLIAINLFKKNTELFHQDDHDSWEFQKTRSITFLNNFDNEFDQHKKLLAFGIFYGG